MLILTMYKVGVKGGQESRSINGDRVTWEALDNLQLLSRLLAWGSKTEEGVLVFKARRYIKRHPAYIPKVIA